MQCGSRATTDCTVPDIQGKIVFIWLLQSICGRKNQERWEVDPNSKNQILAGSPNIMMSLIIFKMSVEIVVSCPKETEIILELEEVVNTRGKENLQVRIVLAWWKSSHEAQSVRWDPVGQLDHQGISDVISWVLFNRQTAFENIPVTRMSWINLIKKQVLCGATQDKTKEAQ